MSAREAELQVRALLEDEPEALEKALEMLRGGSWRWEGAELVDQGRRGTIAGLVTAARERVKHYVAARVAAEAETTEPEADAAFAATGDPTSYLDDNALDVQVDPDLGGTPVQDEEDAP